MSGKRGHFPWRGVEDMCLSWGLHTRQDGRTGGYGGHGIGDTGHGTRDTVPYPTGISIPHMTKIAPTPKAT